MRLPRWFTRLCGRPPSPPTAPDPRRELERAWSGIGYLQRKLAGELDARLDEAALRLQRSDGAGASEAMAAATALLAEIGQVKRQALHVGFDPTAIEQI